MTPETMAGKALLEGIVEGDGDWEAEPFVNEAIVRIEAEARRAVLAELRADWASLKKAIEQIDARIAAIDRRLGGSEP